MPAEASAARLARLRELVERVGGFYLRDRAMSKAQKRMSAALERGAPDAVEVERYVCAVRAYFTGFSREAQAHLKSVDRQLERLYQLQYNMSAERGVAARRVETTQGVLAATEELARE